MYKNLISGSLRVNLYLPSGIFQIVEMLDYFFHMYNAIVHECRKSLHIYRDKNQHEFNDHFFEISTIIVTSWCEESKNNAK